MKLLRRCGRNSSMMGMGKVMFCDGARRLLPLSLFSFIAALSLSGCLGLTLSPPNNAQGLQSPVTIAVTSNTTIANANGTGPAATVPATLDGGAAFQLTCDPVGVTCSAAQPVGPGAHTISVTAPVAWPTFYGAPAGTPSISCNVPFASYGNVNSCATLTASAAFSVACPGQTQGPTITVINGTLIPVTYNQPMSYPLTAVGGCPPYKFSPLSGNTTMPSGLSLSTTGVISGTDGISAAAAGGGSQPNSCGEWTFDTGITVTDALGKTGSPKLTFEVCGNP